MRRFILLLLAGAACAGADSLPSPRSLLDYRFPDSRGSFWTLGVHPWFEFEPGHATPFRQQTRIYPRYTLFRHSERLWLDFYVNTGLEASPFAIDHWPMHTPIWVDGYRYELYASAYSRADWFPGQLPIGLRWDCRAVVRSYLSRSEAWDLGPARTYSRVDGDAGLELGPVVGRVRDATPVVQALRISEVLVEEKAIETQLSPDAIDQLAKVLCRSSDIRRVRDAGRGDKYVYAELERVLLQHAPQLANVPARVWLRIRETVVREGAGMLGTGSRSVGAQLAVVGGIEEVDVGWTWNSGDTVPDPQREQDVQWQVPYVAFSYGRPLSARLHFTAWANVIADNVDTSWPLWLQGEVGLDYLVFDRLRLRGGIRPFYNYVAYEAPSADAYSFSHNVSGSLGYYVEDNVFLSVGAGLEHSFSADSAGLRRQRTSFGFSASIHSKLF